MINDNIFFTPGIPYYQAGYGRDVQYQDHNQFILFDEFGSSHTNIGVLRS